MQHDIRKILSSFRVQWKHGGGLHVQGHNSIWSMQNGDTFENVQVLSGFQTAHYKFYYLISGGFAFKISVI